MRSAPNAVFSGKTVGVLMTSRTTTKTNDMAYSEREFVSDFNRWLKIIFRRTGVFELKVSKTDSLPFDAVKVHQCDALYHAKRSTLAYKIPDDAYAQKPFDCFCVSVVPAFVVIMFNAKSQHFYLIDIDDFIEEARKSERKSITEARAAEIGSKYSLSGAEPYTHIPRQPAFAVR